LDAASTRVVLAVFVGRTAMAFEKALTTQYAKEPVLAYVRISSHWFDRNSRTFKVSLSAYASREDFLAGKAPVAGFSHEVGPRSRPARGADGRELYRGDHGTYLDGMGMVAVPAYPPVPSYDDFVTSMRALEDVPAGTDLTDKLVELIYLWLKQFPEWVDAAEV
jgi:hypothetical protein